MGGRWREHGGEEESKSNYLDFLINNLFCIENPFEYSII